VTDDLRPETVARLTAARPLPQGLVDEVLDASDAERAAAADVLLERTRAHLEQAGVLRPSIGVMDLRYRTVAALAATLGTVQGVWGQPALQDRPLGDVLKVIGSDHAAWVMAMLRWGGLLPPE
jgi:hypothetical protein